MPELRPKGRLAIGVWMILLSALTACTASPSGEGDATDEDHQAWLDEQWEQDREDDEAEWAAEQQRWRLEDRELQRELARDELQDAYNQWLYLQDVLPCDGNFDRSEKPCHFIVDDLTAVDGDTLRSPDGTDIRIVGIDTPEVFPVAECGGREATRYVARVLRARGGNALAISETRQPDRDQYGRLLRHIEFIDGTDLATLLVQEGLARTLDVNGGSWKIGLFEDYERAARREQRGSWATCTDWR